MLKSNQVLSVSETDECNEEVTWFTWNPMDSSR